MSQAMYKAFISYSHQDESWARRIHRALESYRVPKRIVQKYGLESARLFPIFKDRDELASSSNLSETIEDALRRSEHLIVVCSRHAAESRWVNEEIARFGQLGRSDNVHCFLVDDPLVSFPPAALGDVDGDGIASVEETEPLAADARDCGDGPKNAQLKLIAGVLGIGFDELKQRDFHRRFRRMSLAVGVSASMSIAFAVVSIVAVLARDDAERRQSQAEQMVDFMLGDLRSSLEPIGKLGVLDAVGEQAIQYFNTLDASDATDPVLLSRAKALRQLGDIRIQQGKLDEAEKAFDAALRQNRELATRDSNDPHRLYELGQAEFWRGFAAWRKGDLKTAQKHMENYQALSQRALSLDPQREIYLLELGYAFNNLGTLANARGVSGLAAEHFAQAVEVMRKLSRENPDNDLYARELAEALNWMGTAQQALGNLEDSHYSFREQLRLKERLSNRSPSDATLKYRLIWANLHVCESALFVGRSSEANLTCNLAAELALELQQIDPDNLEWVHTYARALWFRGREALSREDLSSARADYESAARRLTRLVSEDSQQTKWRSDLAQALVSLGQLLTGTQATEVLQDAVELVDGLDSDLLRDRIVRVEATCASQTRLIRPSRCEKSLEKLMDSEDGSLNPLVLVARYDALKSQNSLQAQLVAEVLRDIGYREPSFMRSVRDQGVTER